MPGIGDYQFSLDMTGRARHVVGLIHRAGWLVLGAWAAMGWWQDWWRSGIGLGDFRLAILVSLIGTVIALWTAGRVLEAGKRLGRSGPAALAALALSLGCYLLLVWTPWKTHTLLWRIWWVATVGSVAASHLLWLRIAATGSEGPLRRITAGAILAAGLLLAWLAFRADVLRTVPAVWMWTTLAVLAVAAVGSAVFWRRMSRWRKVRAAGPSSFTGRLATAAAVLAATFGVGFYAGRVTAPAGMADAPSALAGLPREQLEFQAGEDLKRLRIIASGLDDLSVKLTEMQKTLRSQRQTEGRDYFTPDEDNRVRSTFMSYLAYRAALLRMIATYGGYAAVRDRDLQARCFLTGYCAAALLMRNSSRLVMDYKDDAVVRRKLNEPEPNWGIAAGLFDQILDNVMSERNANLFAETTAYYQKMKPAWQQSAWAGGVMSTDDFGFVSERIDRAIEEVRGRHLDRSGAAFQRIMKRVKNDAYQPYYATSSLISTWIGDTRMVEREPFISLEQIKALRSRLQSGDVLLERRNWFFSNAFLPGFWPHSALYVGSIDDLAELGLVKKTPEGQWTSDHPAISSKLEQFLKPTHDGHAIAILEAVSEGVIFNSLEESMHADYLAVLRPKLTREQKARAILNAFSHQGKAYDFEFDFFTSDKLVCTELIYWSYGNMLKLKLVRIMGRETLPAVEFCRQFAAERNTPTAQFDFIAFLDTPAGEVNAREGTAEDFIASADRPRGFNE